MKIDINLQKVFYIVIIAFSAAISIPILSISKTIYNWGDLSLSLIPEIITTFSLVTVFLLIIVCLYDLFEHSKLKYYISMLLVIDFLLFIIIAIEVSPYTITQDFVNSIMHTGTLALFIIIIHILLHKKKSYMKLFGLSIACLFIFFLFIGKHSNFNAENINQHREDMSQIYIAIGEATKQMDTYNIFNGVLDLNKTEKEKLKAFYSLQKNFTIINLELIVSSPLMINIFKEQGLCQNWHKFKQHGLNDIISDEKINSIIDSMDNSCKEMETKEK